VLELAVVPASGGSDRAEILELLPAHRGVTMFAAPTVAKRLAERPGAARSDHRGLKTIVRGGGPAARRADRMV
jgi:long-chain acyl-CoA synthetase